MNEMIPILHVALAHLAQGDPMKTSVQASKGSHEAKLNLSQEFFSARGRRIFWLVYAEGKKPKIVTGKLPNLGEGSWASAGLGPRGKERIFQGHDGAYDATGLSATQWLSRGNPEIRKFDLKVNGKSWTVSKHLYEDLLLIHLDTAHMEISPDGKTVRISAGASDGAGGYLVTWAIRSNGKNTRDLNYG